jgi:dipeptidyl aminopeptidase/acylaminoacyl peptidase
LVQRGAAGEITDLTPAGFNVRTRVHEYGGGAWLPCAEAVLFSNFSDQRLYRQEPGGEPEPITPEPPAPAALRYADGRTTPDRDLLVCVRESHLGAEVVNELVALPTDGSAAPRVVASGRDFYSFPRISPDGTRLAWTEWDHPRMPWDGTELRVAPIERSGVLGEPRLVAGGPGESIWQPDWSPAGDLHYVSDRTGWWNLYREAEQPLAPEAAEYGYPQWLFGGSTYACLEDGTILCVRCDRAEERLCRILDGRPEPLGLPYTSFGFPCVRSDGERAIFIAASPAEGSAVVELDVETGKTKVLRESSDERVDGAVVSVPRAIEFPTSGDRTAHAFYYPPRNTAFEGPEGEPTAHRPRSRRPHLPHHPGASARHPLLDEPRLRGRRRELRRQHRVRPRVPGAPERELGHRRHRGLHRRRAIRGGSAGGYTTLCALVFHDDFTAGASYYGVADAETLASDTHKFESRYLDGLIGPYPETAERYRERSPIHYVERLRSPVILFQGLEDEVVPPSQAEQMVAALRANGVPYAYLPFEGEQHGFRRVETIVRASEAELYFYGRIFGFEPADVIEPVPIENL